MTTRDRLTQFDATVGMQYDGDGNRVSRTENGTEVRYLVDEMNPTGWPQVAEEVVGGNVVAQYTHGLMRISQNRDSGSGFVTSYYGYDAEAPCASSSMRLVPKQTPTPTMHLGT